MNKNTLTSEEVSIIFQRIRGLKRSFGARPNRNDLTAALIGACIVEGFDTEPRIVGTLLKLDIPLALSRAVLRHRTGTDPASHMWRLQVDGSYGLLQPDQSRKETDTGQ